MKAFPIAVTLLVLLTGCNDVKFELMTPAPALASATYSSTSGPWLTLTQGTAVALRCTSGNSRAACTTAPNVATNIAAIAPAYSAVLSSSSDFNGTTTTSTSLMVVTGLVPGETDLVWQEGNEPVKLHVVVTAQGK